MNLIFEDLIDGELHNFPAVFTVSDDDTLHITFEQEIPAYINGKLHHTVSVNREFILTPKEGYSWGT